MAKKAYLGIGTYSIGDVAATTRDVSAIGTGYGFSNYDFDSETGVINPTGEVVLGTFQVVYGTNGKKYFSAAMANIKTFYEAVDFNSGDGTFIRHTVVKTAGVARKVKKGYLGILTEKPIYTTQQVNITADNISEYFTVTNGTYYFAGDGDTFTSNNKGKNSTTATTKLLALKDMDVSFTYSYSSESGYDKFTLVIAGTTVESAVSGSTTIKEWSGKLKAGQAIEFTYSKDKSTSRNDDQCTFSGMVCTAEVQTGSVTKELARRLKKAYIGIGGVARPCWTGGELAYYGVVTELSAAREFLAAASNGNHALFGGGMINGKSTYFSTVDAYSKTLTHSLPTALSVGRANLAAAGIKEHVLFGGGTTSSNKKTVDAYDQELTRSTPTELTSATEMLSATSIGDYILFGGGSTGSSCTTAVYAYDKSLAQTRPATLTISRSKPAGVTFGNYALFGGGVLKSGVSAAVDAYDSSLTKITVVDLSTARSCKAATVGDYVLFGSGQYGNWYNVVDVYDASLTRLEPLTFSKARESYGATSLEGYALFGGGSQSGSLDTVEAFDAALTRTNPTPLSAVRTALAATTIGDYALFGGGAQNGSDMSAVVDVYMI